MRSRAITPSRFITRLLNGEDEALAAMIEIPHGERTKFFAQAHLAMKTAAGGRRDVEEIVSVIGGYTVHLRENFCAHLGLFCCQLLRDYSFPPTEEFETLSSRTSGGLCQIMESLISPFESAPCCGPKENEEFLFNKLSLQLDIATALQMNNRRVIAVFWNQRHRALNLGNHAVASVDIWGLQDRLPDPFHLPISCPDIAAAALEREVQQFIVSDGAAFTESVFFNDVKTLIQNVFSVPPREYGSRVNGFLDESSDTDFVVLIPTAVIAELLAPAPEANLQVLAVKRLADEAEKQTTAWRVLAIPTARVPIVRLTCPSPGGGREEKVDVSFQNELGVRNSELLRAYAEIDFRCVALAVLLKRWAKSRNLTDAYQGGLPSYAWMLMLVFYLQTAYVLPNLQQPPFHDPKQTRLVEAFEDVHDTAYFDPPKRAKSRYSSRTARMIDQRFLDKRPDLHERKIHFTPRDREATVAQLIVGFFNFYAFHFNETRDVSSVRLGPLQVEKRNLFRVRDPRAVDMSGNDPEAWARASTGEAGFQLFNPFSASATIRDSSRMPLLCIEDPFESGRALSPTLSGAERIAFEIRRAAVLLMHGESFHTSVCIPLITIEGDVHGGIARHVTRGLVQKVSEDFATDLAVCAERLKEEEAAFVRLARERASQNEVARSCRPAPEASPLDSLTKAELLRTLPMKMEPADLGLVYIPRDRSIGGKPQEVRRQSIRTEFSKPEALHEFLKSKAY